MIADLIGWLVKRELVQGWLYCWAEDYGHLYSEDGELYMGRWSLIAQGSRTSRVLGWLTQGRYTHVRIHWIKQPDHDRELHDHPFNYRTWVMSGWYKEQFIPVWMGRLFNGPALREWQGSKRRLPTGFIKGCYYDRLLSAGDSAAAPLGQFHRIAEVSPSGVWTLFAMGHDHGKWGFLVDGRWVRSHDFFKLRGIAADGTKA